MIKLKIWSPDFFFEIYFLTEIHFKKKKTRKQLSWGHKCEVIESKYLIDSDTKQYYFICDAILKNVKYFSADTTGIPSTLDN